MIKWLTFIQKISAQVRIKKGQTEFECKACGLIFNFDEKKTVIVKGNLLCDQCAEVEEK